jgi:hypothetical protein
MSPRRFCVFGKEPETRANVTPHICQVLPCGISASLVQAVEMPVADLLILDQPRIGEKAEVARDGRPADWQTVSDLLDRVRLARQQLQDRASVGIAQCVKGIASRPGSHLEYGNGGVTVTELLR